MPAQHDAPLISSTPSGPNHRLATMPILMLNVHSRCNCRCVMCDIWKREDNEQIRAADVERHRASLRNLGVHHVVLTGGEPLLNNDLGALCTFFRRQNIRLTLLTTGLLLFKRADDVATHFDDVIVSIDGPREIHDSIRRIDGAFELIRRGIVAVRERNPSLPITCRTTIQRANHSYLRETVVAAKSLGFNSISFLAADLTSEAFNRPLVWPGERQSEIALNSQEADALDLETERLILEHEAEIHENYILESPTKLRRIARRFREHLGQAAPESPVCNAPWVSAVVEVDGSVRPCFFHRTFGSVASSTLEEVINGEAAVTFRQSLNVETNPVCQRCVCSLNYPSASVTTY
jgi:Fe-coproporphyrin III synthase